jgi:hypothetical protein
MKNRLPQIVPSRRYPTPRYPSFLDPNPLDEPQPVPFPYGEKLLGTACALGIVAGLSGCTAGEGKEEVEVPESNPFAFHHSGLPHQSSSFGTGRPSRLSQGRATEVIERVFEEAGYELKKDEVIQGVDLEYTATGYDRDRRVGYVFASYLNLESDLYMGWVDPLAYPEGPDQELQKIAAPWQGDQWGEPDEARKILQMKPGPERDRMTAELIREWHARRLSLAEAELLGTREMQEGRFVALISGVDGRLVYRGSRKVALQRLEKEVREYIAWVRRQQGR